MPPMSANLADQDGLTWPYDELARRLSAKGALTEENFKKALKLANEMQEDLAEVLVNLNLLSKPVVYEELANIYEVPFVDLETYTGNPLVTALVDEKTARELQVFPLFAIGESLTVALADPGDILVLDRLATETKHQIEPCLSARYDIQVAIHRAYIGRSEVKEFLDTLGEQTVPDTANVKTPQAATQGSESPVSRLVDLVVAQAVRDRASDIHIDPYEEELKVRFRIDGVLYEIPPPPKYLHPFIVSRVKIMSAMDIAENRVPQDGHFQAMVDGRPIEARVSIVPTIHGENVMIRLLDTGESTITLENLGLSADLLPRMEALIRRPHGMAVVTGPTGSGKSTSLYAMLAKAKSPERHIVTVEDPVERRIRMVSQIQINEKAGMVFASALRSILRQDPDVIMVGEIRDQETAQLAVRAALTGHLVFSTLHTNDAPSAIIRLINMNVEAFLVSSALAGVVAQRLVRCICEKCKEACEIDAGLQQRLEASGVALPRAAWRGKGCSRCRNTGYSGRIAVFEIMSVTPELAEMISANVSIGQLRAQARQDGMGSMLEDGLAKVGQGITTLEEVLRVSQLEGVMEPAPLPPAMPAAKAAPPEPEMEIKVPEKVQMDFEDYRTKMTNWLVKKPG